MDRRWIIAAGAGCLMLLFLAAAVVVILAVVPFRIMQSSAETTVQDPPVAGVTAAPGFVATQEAVPTLGAHQTELESFAPLPDDASLADLYAQLNPGVVNVQVFINQEFGGQGAGSGFILDENGYIITNNHVVADADEVTVVFYDGLEMDAAVVGTDDDSDLAVLKVDQLPDDVTPLPLGDSDQVETGEWVIAIGNPFRLGGSITLGIVSAVGRSIPSGVTPFAIPQAIQTDAAINPGNSGGPLLNLQGEVIGVNAQIRTSSGVAANSGVGFAVPVNVVRRVAPVLIEQGRYQWPWLGVNQPASVNLLIQEANDLETQQGVYIHQVVPDGPADQAGLQGSSGQIEVNGLTLPTGGDVIVAVNGETLANLDDMLVDIAFSNPGDDMVLTVLRDGEEQQITVTLEARPQTFE